MINTSVKDRLMVCFPYGHFDWSISSRENIYNIVSTAAYKDMTPRHLKGIGKYKSEKAEIFSYTTNQLVDYFSQPVKNKEEFEEWHKNLCEEVCRQFSALPGIELMYGKAQKLINITFKHLYCFGDANKKENYFKYCHIPIDNNIISWCKKNVGITSLPTAWSNLSYSDYIKLEDSLYSWLNSEKNIEYHNDDGTPYSQLQIDFIAWISKSDARKGVIEYWKSIQRSSDIWNQYKETVVSVLSELEE